MTNMKATKKALLSSVLALVLCFSMLLGTTFAWFTDSVTSEGNIIKSGTLEVLMDWADGKADPAADTTEWKDASEEAIFNYNLWEPGYVDVKHIRVTNDGTLALKYQMMIEANGEVSDLAKVIDVYFIDGGKQIAARTDLDGLTPVGTLDQVIDNFMNLTYGELTAGTSEIVTIALKMQETAGNDYQDKSIGSDFSVKLLATQLASETDSFDEQYDADAWFDLQKDASGAYLIYSAKDLMALNAMLNEEGLLTEGSPIRMWVKLMADIDMSGYDWLSINEMFVSFDGQGHTISNLNCIENGHKSGFFAYLGGGIIQNLTLENVTSVGSQAGIFAGQSEGGKILNCTIAGTNYVAWDDDSGDTVTKNGIGAFAGVSYDVSILTGTIASGAVITLNENGMTGGWGENVDKYAGGYNTAIAELNVTDLSVETEQVAEGLNKDAAGNYYIYNAEGLASTYTMLTTNNAGRYTLGFNRTYNILTDIDATGITWNSIWLEGNSGNENGMVLNGNGHTISNLTIGGSLFSGVASGTGGTPAVIKNLTFDNATVTSDGYHVAVVWGQVYGDLTIENVNVVNSKVSGLCNVAALIGATTYEGSNYPDIVFKNCSVENTAVTATGDVAENGCDPFGASAFLGRAYGLTTIKFEGTNTVSGNTLVNTDSTMAASGVYAYGIYDGGWKIGGSVSDYTDFDGYTG